MSFYTLSINMNKEVVKKKWQVVSIIDERSGKMCTLAEEEIVEIAESVILRAWVYWLPRRCNTCGRKISDTAVIAVDGFMTDDEKVIIECPKCAGLNLVANICKG